MIHLQRDSSTPLYEQIREAISEKIASGEWECNYLLPPYKDLIKLWGVSMITIQQSVGNLIKEGLLQRKRGEGVLVADKRLTQSTHALALLIPDVRHPFFSILSHTIQNEAFRHGYMLSMFSLDAEAMDEPLLSNFPITTNFDGLITTPTVGRSLGTLFTEISRRHTPLVFVDGISPERKFDYVEIDNERAIRLVLDHLVDLGHREIAFAGAHPMTVGVQERLTALRAVMQEKQLPLAGPRIQISHLPNDLGGEHAAETLLSLRTPPTAIICSNDLAAAGVLRTIRRAGLSCPGSISVVGFDDLELSAHLDPPLTTVRQPVVEIGRIAFEMLLERLSSTQPKPAQSRVLAPTLVVRASTGSAPALTD